MAVVVGGDGTMLGVARQMASHGTPLVGINQGRLGFITDISIRAITARRSRPSVRRPTRKSARHAEAGWSAR